MHVLFTNNTLEHEAGSECSVRDAATELIARGHRVSAFSCQLGTVARQLAEAGAEIVADLSQMRERPEVIHGHHQWETTLAALRWPDAPLISFRRGIDPWQEAPCLAPWTAAWVGVDRPCLRHLTEVDGVPEERAHLLLNGINFDGLEPRRELPEKPGDVLVLSNYATEDSFLKQIREACRSEDVRCDAIGRGVHNPKDNLLELLPSYDLVFAKGRAALEAAAAGCAVVVCDYGGIGEFVTPANFDRLRERSFFYDCKLEAVTVEIVRQRLSEWRPGDTLKLSEKVRETCSLQANIDALEKLYATAVGAHRAPSADEVGTFTSQFLADKGLPYKLGREVQAQYRTEKQAPAPDDAESAAVEWNRSLNLYRRGREAAHKLDEITKAAEATKAEEERPAKKTRRWLRRAGG